MTEDQFNSICTYVREQLKDKEKFTIHHRDFEKIFDLSHPYYKEMIRLAEKHNVDFSINASYKNRNYQPTDVITFSR